MEPVEQVVAFSSPALGVAVAAGAVASWRTPGARLTSALQHLTAGVVFAAGALEVLPRERHGDALPVTLGFAIGLALMFAMRYLARRVQPADHEKRLPAGLVAVTAFDLLIDGIVLGISFAAGTRTGLLLTIALTLEVLFQALSVGSAMARAGAQRWLTWSAAASLGAVLIVSGAASRHFLGNLTGFPLTMLLGIGTVALLYLVVEELLVEAHQIEDTVWTTTAFFGGFLLFLLIEVVADG
jgi:ZIP family zinc transporter